ncbi:MAG: proline--tRNA ligase [Myxococcota bacterium]
MRFSRSFIPTLKEAPAEATSPSHVLLLRAGCMRKVAAGIYTFLPLGLRALAKIQRIVREEMTRAGAQEVLMPAVQPAELWQESGRWEQYGPELLRFKDRKGTEFCLGPTHEEVIVDLVRRDVRSYRQLPVCLFQIQAKFRDELRPRGGLLRGREFIMKDAYSFDADVDAAGRSYDVMFAAYERIFRRCGLEFRAVEADTGPIGGTRSHEFQVLADTGEDSIVACDACDYAANVEKAEARAEGATGAVSEASAAPPVEKVATPGKRTVEEVCAFLQVSPSALVKTLIYLADGKPIAALVRGDREVNEVKLKRAAGARDLLLGNDAAIAAATGGPVGFSGPVGLKIPIFADNEVRAMADAVVGANAADTHLRHVAFGRDFDATVVDLRQAAAGDACPRCARGRFRFFRGIEVGHVFFLGTKYSEPMKCTFLDEKGVEKPAIMGCYGIGITRIAAAAVEQNRDAAGIAWPMPIAPFHVTVLPAQMNVPRVVETAEKLHDALEASGVEVLLDDRDERAGVKFKDADLLGAPLRVTIGEKSLAKGVVELKERLAKEPELVPVEDAARVIAERVKARLG